MDQTQKKKMEINTSKAFSMLDFRTVIVDNFAKHPSLQALMEESLKLKRTLLVGICPIKLLIFTQKPIRMLIGLPLPTVFKAPTLGLKPFTFPPNCLKVHMFHDSVGLLNLIQLLLVGLSPPYTSKRKRLVILVQMTQNGPTLDFVF